MKIPPLENKMINKFSKKVDKTLLFYYNLYVGAYVEAYKHKSCLMKGDSNE